MNKSFFPKLQSSHHPTLLCFIRFTSLFVTLALLFLIAFEAINTNHTSLCHKDNCPLCIAMQIIHSTNKIAKKTSYFRFSNAFIKLNKIFYSVLIFLTATEVSKKIKLVI